MFNIFIVVLVIEKFILFFVLQVHNEFIYLVNRLKTQFFFFGEG